MRSELKSGCIWLVCISPAISLSIHEQVTYNGGQEKTRNSEKHDEARETLLQNLEKVPWYRQQEDRGNRKFGAEAIREPAAGGGCNEGWDDGSDWTGS